MKQKLKRLSGRTNTLFARSSPIVVILLMVFSLFLMANRNSIVAHYDAGN